MANIRDAINEFNPWWKGGFDLKLKEREVYGRMQKFMTMPHIIALVGLRRVGKTSIMQQIIKDYLDRGFERRRIFYFSFDEFRNSDIREILTVYEDMVGFGLRDGKYLVLLDEIQKNDGWENQLKVLYDLYGKNVKFIISGSESLFIRKNTKESLAGRLFEFKIEPLNFKEFLAFKEARYDNIKLYSEELRRAFWEFSQTMGFPELVGVRDKDLIKKYLKEGIVDKVLYRDIPQMIGIRDAPALDAILNVFMEDPGQMADLNELAAELKISRQTISSYVYYLEAAFLLNKLYNYSGSRRKVERKLKKYYPEIISVDLLMRDDDHSRSRVFEWFVVTRLGAEFFWRDPFKNEVDVIMADGTPLEIKYGKIDLAGIKAFMRKFKRKKGIVITHREKGTRKEDGFEINLIPAYEFLLRFPL
jgi:hypothetical protein